MCTGRLQHSWILPRKTELLFGSGATIGALNEASGTSAHLECSTPGRGGILAVFVERRLHDKDGSSLAGGVLYRSVIHEFLQRK